jgi:tetratricopeptide (TPR) repeat protein
VCLVTHIIFLVLAAFPLLAQNPPASPRNDKMSPSKNSNALPASCLSPQHSSQQMSVLLETVRNHPTAGAYNTLGALYAQADRVACAISAFQAALQLDGENWQAHYNLGLALLRKGNRPRAEQEFRAAIQWKPDSAAAHFALATLLQDEQRPGAEQEFKKVIEIDPAHTEAQNSLGMLYTRQGKDAEAAALFRQAIRNDPNFAGAHVNLGLTLARQEAFVQAEKEFRAALQIEPNNVEAYRALGMLQAKTGRVGDAVESFRNVVNLLPKSSEAHLNLGIALVDAYDRTAGFQEFVAALRLDPNSAGAHYNLGRFFFESSKYDQARSELETALRLQPDFAGACYFLALTERQVDNTQRATDLFQKVVALQPDNADAQYLLGRSLERAGETSQAIAHWKMALQADPNLSEALYSLARIMKKISDPEAQHYQDRFDELQQKQQIKNRVGQLGNFAIQAANAQNWPQALQEMQEAIALCGQCEDAAHLHKNLGLMYCRTGKLDDAQKELDAAVALNPDDPDAKKAIGMLQSLRVAQGENPAGHNH